MQSRTKLTDGASLGIRGIGPCRDCFFPSRGTSHLAGPHAILQALDLDRGVRVPATRLVAIAHQVHHVRINIRRIGLRGCGGRRGRAQRAAAAAGGTMPPCARGAVDEEAEPAAAANGPTLPCAGGAPDDEEEPEAAAAADGPAPPYAAIHSHRPADATLS